MVLPQRRSLMPLVEPVFEASLVDRCLAAQIRYSELVTPSSKKFGSAVAAMSCLEVEALANEHSLRHELCAYMGSEINGDGAVAKRNVRTGQEIAAYHKLIARADLFAAGMGWLSKGNLLCGGTGVIRRQGMRLQGTNGATPILMPNQTNVSGRVNEIWRLISIAIGSDTSSFRVPSIVTATWLMALLTNIHPFNDGNGRLSRVVFNIILSRALGLCDNYLDISTCMWLAQGGFEIRLRQAELHGEWNPLIGFMCDSIDLMHTQAAPNAS